MFGFYLRFCKSCPANVQLTKTQLTQVKRYFAPQKPAYDRADPLSLGERRGKAWPVAVQKIKPPNPRHPPNGTPSFTLQTPPMGRNQVSPTQWIASNLITIMERQHTLAGTTPWDRGIKPIGLMGILLDMPRLDGCSCMGRHTVYDLAADADEIAQQQARNFCRQCEHQAACHSWAMTLTDKERRVWDAWAVGATPRSNSVPRRQPRRRIPGRHPEPKPSIHTRSHRVAV